MNNIIITLKKELRSIFRDKKTIIRIFLFPLIITGLIILYGEIFDNMGNEETTYTIHGNYKLNEIEKDIMKENNIEYNYNKDTRYLEKELSDGNISSYIVYDNNKYTIYYDSSSTSGLTEYEMIHYYLDNYNTYLTNNYLVENNINLEEAYNHFEIEEVEVGNNSFDMVIILNVLFIYIMMAITMSASSMATVSTASEKENGTLETILTFPIKKTELIVGKYLSNVVVCFMSGLVSLFLLIGSLIVAKSKYDYFSTINVAFNIKTILFGIIIISLASIIIAGLAFALCAKAKSFKEAQSSVGFMNMLTLIPMVVNMTEVSINTTYYLIPICNYTELLMDLFIGTFNITNLIMCLVSSIALSFILIEYIIISYNSEKVLFGN